MQTGGTFIFKRTLETVIGKVAAAARYISSGTTEGHPLEVSVRVLIGTLTTLWVSGCTDPLRPADVVGTYVLTTIQGSPPPRIILDVPGCRHTVVGGELVLSSDALFRLTLEERNACPEPPDPGETGGELWVGEYSVNGRGMILTAQSSETVDVPAEFRGERMVVEMGGRVGVLVFDRTSSEEPPCVLIPPCT
jgi:hypothetical protein